MTSPLQSSAESPSKLEPERAASQAKSTAVVLVAILLLGTLLRLYGLNAKSFWYDEGVSWQALNFSMEDLLERKYDVRSVHPPLYFVLLHPWAAVWGDSEFALRSLAAVFGVVTILGTYCFVRALWAFPPAEARGTSSGAALLAAALVAANPMQILNSQQVRGYSLATALVVWCGWALLRGLEPGSRRPYLIVVASLLAAAICFTNYLAAVSVGALAAFAMCYLVFHRGETIPLKWPLAAAALFILLFAIPWLPRFVDQAENVRHSPHLARPFVLYSLPANIHRALLSTWGDRPSQDRLEVWGTSVAVAMLLSYSAALRGWKGSLLALTGAVPVLVITGYSCLSVRTIVSARYFSFAQLSWLCAISYAVFRVDHQKSRCLLAGWSVLMSLLLCGVYWRAIGRDDAGGIRAAAQQVRSQRKPGEAFIAADHRVFYAFKYYMRSEPGRARLLVATGNRHDTIGAENLADADIISPQSLADLNSSAIWVMTSKRNDSPYRSWLASARYEFEERWEFRSDYFWEPPLYVEYYSRRTDR